MNKNVLFALGAAALFGASTPVAKLLTGDMSPVLLAGLLYLGSGVGLTLARLIRDGGLKPSGLPRSEWPWLLGAVFFGGVLGPVALMSGLVSTSGSTASLLFNLEAVLTAVIAWVVFKENADRRIILGMLAIVAGGIALGWQTGSYARSAAIGPILVSLACLCWAIDNNLTRQVSASDALFYCMHQRGCCWYRKHGNCSFNGRDISKLGNRFVNDVCWPFRLWRQFSALRIGIARPGNGPNRCLFLNRTIHWCRCGLTGIHRSHFIGILDCSRANGPGCMAAPHGRP